MTSAVKVPALDALPRREGPYAVREFVGSLLWSSVAGGMVSWWLWVTGRPYLVILAIVAAVLLTVRDLRPEVVIENDALVFRNGMLSKWKTIPFADIRELRWRSNLKSSVLQLTYGSEARSAEIPAILQKTGLRARRGFIRVFVG